MTHMIVLNTEVPSTSLIEYAGGSVATSNQLISGPRSVPAAIRLDEAYYWSSAWQVDVRKSMEELAAGEYEEFSSEDPADVVRWMLSDDEPSA